MSGGVVSAAQQFDQAQEEVLAQQFASQNGLQYMNLLGRSFNADTLKKIPLSTAQKFSICAFDIKGNQLFIAATDPFRSGLSNEIAKIANESGLVPLPFVVSNSSITYALQQYQSFVPAIPPAAAGSTVPPLPSQTEIQPAVAVDQIAKQINQSSTTDMFETLLASAILLNTSDIHLEPMEKTVKIRFRVDGKLLPIIEIDEKKYLLLASRIKTAANIKLDLHKIAQDGRMSVKVGKEGVDIRVNVLPGAYGETIELRLLRSANFKTLDQLGLPEATKTAILNAIAKTEGLVLFTGPTGSGKTTSLYAALQLLNKPESKLMTIEDPVEYHLDGIEQIQINARDGFDFADALRAVLRQDPNVIMVGEIRDKETAEIAVNAAMTGHLVLSTLHTNSAVAAFTRLLQMGVPKYLLTDAITLVVAQRLVRKLCLQCGGTGCAFCHNTGYSGRMLIAEHYEPNEKTAELIRREATLKEFELAFAETGNKTVLQDGLERVQQGVTTEQEVRGVA